MGKLPRHHSAVHACKAHPHPPRRLLCYAYFGLTLPGVVMQEATPEVISAAKTIKAQLRASLHKQVNT
jgi:hypothetical protein